MAWLNLQGLHIIFCLCPCRRRIGAIDKLRMAYKMGGGESAALKAVLLLLIYTASVEAGPVNADGYKLGGKQE